MYSIAIYIIIFLIIVINIILLYNNNDIEKYESNTPTPTLIGSNKCTWGPSYWCASEENAKECNYPYARCIDYNKTE